MKIEKYERTNGETGLSVVSDENVVVAYLPTCNGWACEGHWQYRAAQLLVLFYDVPVEGLQRALAEYFEEA